MVDHHREHAAGPDRSQLGGVTHRQYLRSGLLGPLQQSVPLAAVDHRRLVHDPPLPGTRHRVGGEEPGDVPPEVFLPPAGVVLVEADRLTQLVGGFLRRGQRPRLDPVPSHHRCQGTHRGGLARPGRRRQV